MNTAVLIAFLLASAAAAAPLMFAALGALVNERAGVLNMGVEGMMLLGAVAAFAVTLATGSAMLGLLAALLAGLALALLFAVMVLTLQANQVAAGMAVTLLGAGLSALLGRDLTGQTVVPMPALAFAPLLLAPAVGWLCGRTRTGRALRAVGRTPHEAHAIGLPVTALRYGAILFGGAMAALGGACLSLTLMPGWEPGMTAGRGFIALGIVVFAGWRPWAVMAGAWLFGGAAVLPSHLGNAGLVMAPEFLSMLPYLATIVALVYICRDPHTVSPDVPHALGVNFKAD